MTDEHWDECYLVHPVCAAELRVVKYWSQAAIDLAVQQMSLAVEREADSA